MKIQLTTPLGQMLELTAPDGAKPDELQSVIDSTIQQYESHTSPSQLRMKTGKELVQPEPPSPGFIERTKAEFGAGLDEFRQGLQNLKPGGGPLTDPNLAARPKVDLTIPPMIAGPMRAVNAPVSAAGSMAGEATLGATGSPLAATVANMGVQQLALGGMGRVAEALKGQKAAAATTGLGEGARVPTAAETIALETGTPVVAGQETPLPNKYAPLAARSRQTPAEVGAAAIDAAEGTPSSPLQLGTQALGAHAQQTFEDLKRTMFDEAPPDKVITKRGRKAKVVHNTPEGKAIVAGEDGLTTIEDPKSLTLDPSDVAPTPEEAAAVYGTKADYGFKPRGKRIEQNIANIESFISPKAEAAEKALAEQEARFSEFAQGEMAGGGEALPPMGEESLSSKAYFKRELPPEPPPAEETDWPKWGRPREEWGGPPEPPAKIQTKPPPPAPEAAPAAAERDPALDKAVNMRKPPTSEALHATESPIVGLRPAIRVGGKVYAGEPGEVHNDILARIPGGKELQKAIVEGKESDAGTHGFVTKNGMFLSRNEATQLVGTSKDVKAAAKAEAPPAAPVQSAKRSQPTTLTPKEEDNVRILVDHYENVQGPIPEGYSRREIREATKRIKASGIKPVARPSPGVPETAPSAEAQAAARPAPPTATEEVKAMLPEAAKEGKRAVGKLGKKLDPYSIKVGREVDTAKGPGKIENFNINDEGDFIFDVRLDTGKLVKLPTVFDILRSEKGQISSSLLAPQAARAIAGKAVTAATDLSKKYVRPYLSPATVSPEAGEAAVTLRQRLGELHADHAVTEHRFQEVETLFDKYTPAEQAQFYQRFLNGTPQVGAYAPELNKIATTFRDTLARRERYYKARGWGLNVNAEHVASLFKRTDRGNQFADIITARDKTHSRIANVLQNLNQQQREDFFNRMMVTRAQGTPLLTASAQKIAPFFRGFKNPNNAKRAFDRFYGPHGIAGTNRAHYDFFVEGLMSELEPVSYNPARLVQSRLYEMDKGAMRDKLLYDMKDQILFVKEGQAKPIGFDKLEYYKGSTVGQAKYFQPHLTGRRGEKGEWYAPVDMARIVNNELAPGLRGMAPYDKIRDLTMLQTMSRLGLSAFHATEVVMASPVVAIGHAWKDLINARSLRGATDAGKRLATLGGTEPWRYYGKGKAIRNEFFEKWGTDNPVSDTLKHIIASNMRVGHDEQYATQWSRAFNRALNERSYGRAALDFYPMLLEKFSGPLFNHLIPNLKVGAMVTKMERELKAMPPGSGYNDIIERLMKHADDVDNIFGMVNYDNYHLKKGFRDGLFVVFQAPGWFLGSYRQLKGAVGESGEQIAHLMAGKRPMIGDKQAFWLGMATVHPLASMIMQYAMTGTFPEVDLNSMQNTLRNFLTHKTGRNNPDGTPERRILPGYHKEAWHMIKDAMDGPAGVFDYLYGKTSGVVQDVNDLVIKNKDFFGNQIMTPPKGLTDIPGIAKAAGQAALHELGSPLPIGLKAGAQAARREMTGKFRPNRTLLDTAGDTYKSVTEHPYETARNVVGGFLGEVNAPAYMTKSAVMNYFSNLSERRKRTVEGAYRASQKYDLIDDLRKAKTPAEQTRLQTLAQKDSELQPSDIADAVKESRMSPMEHATQHVDLPGLIHGLRYATPEERRELNPIITKRWNNSIKDHLKDAKALAAEWAQYKVGK